MNRQAGQAQHLAEWKARQKQARGDILYMPAGEQWRQMQEENARLKAQTARLCRINKRIVLTVAAGAGIGLVALLVHYFYSWWMVPAAIGVLIIIDSLMNWWRERKGNR